MNKKSDQNKGGRPKKEPTVPITTRYTKTESEELKKRVKEFNFDSVSAYTRYCTLENTLPLRARRSVQIEEKELIKLQGQLGRVAGNIHQLVKYQNIQKEGVDRASYLRAIASFNEVTNAIFEALGKDEFE